LAEDPHFFKKLSAGEWVKGVVVVVEEGGGGERESREEGFFEERMAVSGWGEK